jgi:hypothetical protein
MTPTFGKLAIASAVLAFVGLMGFMAWVYADCRYLSEPPRQIEECVKAFGPLRDAVSAVVGRVTR